MSTDAAVSEVEHLRALVRRLADATALSDDFAQFCQFCDAEHKLCDVFTHDADCAIVQARVLLGERGNGDARREYPAAPAETFTLTEEQLADIALGFEEAEQAEPMTIDEFEKKMIER